MEADDLWFFRRFEVAIDSIANVCAYFVQFIALREDGFTQSSRRVTTIQRRFDQKDNLVHTGSSDRASTSTGACVSTASLILQLADYTKLLNSRLVDDQIRILRYDLVTGL